MYDRSEQYHRSYLQINAFNNFANMQIFTIVLEQQKAITGFYLIKWVSTFTKINVADLTILSPSYR